MSKVEKYIQSSDSGPPVKDRFPRIVLVIVLAEFCERFSYSGMRAFLALYLRSKLGYTDDEATETYHIFSTFVYVFPIIGGILADNYFGKFRTILYMMFVYAAGNMLVAVTAIPQIGLPPRLFTLLGLFMITIGTGGIKPCVSAFGGDQFKLPQQEHQMSKYFSLLYFTLCIGSLIAKTVSPILRSEVHCFGDKDCYSLAFGAPGLIVFASIVIFVSAKNRYVMKKPEGNIVVDFVKCVALGLKNAIFRRNTENNCHWLDSTQHHYDKRFLRDIKRTLTILMLFTVVPIFWALLDQMGSRWTLQATKMDGNFGFTTVKPDQLQVLAPIFIVILIPISQKYIYPFLETQNLFKNPLHKMTLGGVLAGIAFIASAIVEICLKTTYPQIPQLGYSQLRVFNGNPCPVSAFYQEENITYDIPSLTHFSKKDFKVDVAGNISLMLKGECIRNKNVTIFLEENQAVSFFLNKEVIHRFIDRVDKSKSGLPVLRFLVSNSINTSITLYNEKRWEIETSVDKGVSLQTEVFASIYSLRTGNDTIRNNIELRSGGVYVIIIDNVDGEYKSELVIVTPPNSITMALLLPQFFIMAVAEVLFSLTGLEFAFKEAPESMKAVMTAVWLLTEAVGNVIIIVITRLFAGYAQETQSFIYTGLMFVAVIIFHYLAKGYQFGSSYHAQTQTDCKKERNSIESMYMHVKQTEDCLDHC